jgi:hypothetical protein
VVRIVRCRDSTSRSLRTPRGDEMEVQSLIAVHVALDFKRSLVPQRPASGRLLIVGAVGFVARRKCPTTRQQASANGDHQQPPQFADSICHALFVFSTHCLRAEARIRDPERRTPVPDWAAKDSDRSGRPQCHYRFLQACSDLMPWHRRPEAMRRGCPAHAMSPRPAGFGVCYRSLPPRDLARCFASILGLRKVNPAVI